MGFIGICIDFFAWPLIALVYPIFASIKAIESGSKYRMRKLVIYWTLFSLISLYEFAFVKIIEWIPCWSTIRLIAIFWLVMPQFDGACNAYECIIRPCLCVDLQAVIDRFFSPKKENKLCRMETFPDVVAQFIKENGVEALEELISSKHGSKEPHNSQRDIQVLKPEEKDAAAKKGKDATAEVNETTSTKPTTATRPPTVPSVQKRKDVTAEAKETTATKPTATTEAKETTATKPTATTRPPTIFWVQKGKDTTAEVNEKTATKPTATAMTPEIPPMRKEWRCDLCNVTTSSENALNAHLQGRKHKSKSGKPSATGNSIQDNTEAAKGKVGQGSQQKSTKTEQDAVSTQQFKLWCSVCDVKLLSEIDLASHLKWEQDSANIHKIVKL